MKILFVTRKYPPAIGGMELFAFELSSALATKTDIRLVKWSGYGRLKAVLWVLPQLFIRSLSALMRGGIDVIHVQDGVLAPMAFILGKLFRKPYVVVVHGLDLTYPNKIFQAVALPAIRRANAVICISQAATLAAQDQGVASAKIHQLPLAVKDNIYGQSDRQQLLSRLNLPPTSQILLSVGRLVPRKGVAWLVNNVLPSLNQRYPEMVYLVVGEGPDKTAIEAAMRRHHLEKQVRLLGQAEVSLLAAAYNGANIYIMPNIKVPGDMEGFGLVLLEASLSELPIVASRLEGIQDAVQDGQNGVLVRPGDAQAFVEQIGSFLDNPKAAHQFGKNSRRYTLSHYQWSRIADRYLEVYEQVG